ncbi:copia protein [Tanacetum coccineum]|uniref:Copia protein n=1 Tax=Tanacetum coccineum TaxID=301880 RepID=A0ABQ5IZS6_9ASTR
MTIIGTKWVFRNKLDENGIVSRNKARLVAQGYNQQEGINYDETYALVARLESIRILLAYACALDFKLFQIDVKSAFLNGLINEDVYVAQPPGFIDFQKPDHVYKLKKALYGLKQAPKACCLKQVAVAQEARFVTKQRLAYQRFLRTDASIKKTSKCAVRYNPDPKLDKNNTLNLATTVYDGKIVVQDVRGRYKANNQGRPFQRNTCKWEKVYLWNVGAQNRGGMINPGQAKPIKCYNCNGLGHNRHENVPRPEAASRFRLTSRTRCY